MDSYLLVESVLDVVAMAAFEINTAKE